MRSMFLLFSAHAFVLDPVYISLPKNTLCVIKQIRCHDKEQRMLEVENKIDSIVRLCFD